MNNILHLQIDAVQLRNLLERAGDDPILVPQLQERLAEAEQQLQEARQNGDTLFSGMSVASPRTALFLRGAAVQGTDGIDPKLAGEALLQYERMYVEQAIHDEREAARAAGRQRRPRGAPTPRLLFSGTPRGSFGLEFTPSPINDQALMEVHSRSLSHVADAISAVADVKNASLGDVISKIPPQVLSPLKSFLKTLSQYGAELRIAFQDTPARVFRSEQIRSANERLERDTTISEETVMGVFRGVTRETGYFDFKTDDDEVISGTVSDNMTEDDMERIHSLTNKRCKASFQKTTITDIKGGSRPNYVLRDCVAI